MSINSPPIRENSTKKVNSRPPSHLRPSPGQSLEKYTVVFPTGPIGIELEPTNTHARSHCRVQRLVNATTVAAESVQPGDVVISVNGTVPDTYPQTIQLLRTEGIREVLFERCQKATPLDEPTAPSSVSAVPGSTRRSVQTPVVNSTGSNNIKAKRNLMSFSASSDSSRPSNDDSVILSDFAVAPPPQSSTSKQQLWKRLEDVASEHFTPTQDIDSKPLVQEQHNQLLEVRKELEMLQREKDSFDKAYKEQEEEKSQLEERVKALDKERESRETQFREIQEKTKQTEQDRDTLSAQYVELHQALQQSQKEKEQNSLEAKEALEAEKSKSENLKQLLDSTKEKLSDVQSEVVETKGLMEQLSSARSTEQGDLQTKLSSVLEAKATLEGDVANFQKIIRSLQLDNATMKQNEQIHVKNLDEVQRHHRGLEEKLSEAERQRLELDRKFEDLRNLSLEQACSLGKARERETRATNRLNDQTARLDELRQELEAHQSSLAQRQLEWRVEKENLEKKLKDTEDDLVASKKQTSISRDEMAKLSQTRNALEDSFNSAQSRLEVLEEERTSKLVEVSVVENLRARISTLEQTVSEKTENEESLQSRLEHVNSDLQKCQNALVSKEEELQKDSTSAEAIQSSLKKDLELLRSDNTDLVSKNKKLKADLKQNIEISCRATKRSADLENLNSSLRQELDSVKLRHEAVSVAAESNALSDIEERDTKIADLKTTLNCQAETIESLKSQLGRIQLERDEYQKRFVCLDDQNKALTQLRTQELESSLGETQSIVQDLQKQLQEKEQAIDHLSQLLSNERTGHELSTSEEAANASNALQAKDIEISKLKAELAKNVNRDGELKDLGSQLHYANVTLKALEGQLHMRSEKAILVLEEAKKSLSMELDSARSDNEKLSAQVSQLEQDVEHKSTTVSVLTKAQGTILNEKKRLSDQVARITSELRDADNRISMLQKNNVDVSSRLALLQKESSTEKDGMVSELVALQDELGSQRKRNIDLEQLLRAMRRSTSQMDARERQLRGKVETETQLLRNDKIRLESQLRGLKKRVESLKEEARRFRDEGTEAGLERDKLCIEVVDLKIVIDAMGKDQSFLKSALSKLETTSAVEKQHLSEKLVEKQGQIDFLTKELESRESERRSLQREKTSSTGISADQSRQLVELQEEVTHLRLQANEDKRLRSLIIDLRSNIKAATEEVEVKTNLCERNAEEVIRLSELLETSRREATKNMQDMSKRHRSLISSLSRAKDEAAEDLTKAEEGLQKAQRQFQESCTKMSSLSQERDALVSEKRELVAKLATLSKDRESSKEKEATEIQERLRESRENACHAERKILDLEKQLSDSEAERESFKSKSARYLLHAEQLEGDLDQVSSELKQLMATNIELESRLSEVASDREDKTVSLEAVTAQCEAYEKSIGLMKKQLDDQSLRCQSLTSVNLELRSSMDTLALQTSGRTRALSSLEDHVQRAMSEKSNLLTKLRETTEKIRVIEDSAHQETDQLRQELNATKQELSRAQTEISSMKTGLGETESKLCQEVESLKNAATESKLVIDSSETALQETRACLRETEDELESVSSENVQNKVRLQKLQAQFEESQHRLSVASRTISCHEETIKAHNLQFRDTKQVDAALRIQIRFYQTKVKKLENSLADKESAYSTATENSTKLSEHVRAQKRSVDEKVASLHEELAALRDKVNTLQSERKQWLSDLQDCRDSEGLLSSKLTASQELVQKQDSRIKSLEDEIDSKVHENGHLKAKTHVLNSSLSRLQTEKVLVEETLLQLQSKHDSRGENDSNVKSLIVENEAKGSKLEYMEKVLVGTRNREARLLDIVRDTLKGLEASVAQLLSAPDQEGDIEDLRQSFSLQTNALKEAVSIALSAIESKFAKEESPLSPSQKAGLVPSSPGSPQSPTVLDSFFKMKKTPDCDYSPGEHGGNVGVNECAPVDVEYMKRVIKALEAQIDSLLADLQEANDALQQKDELFANLEDLVAHQESRGDLLEQQLMDSKAALQNVEEQLQVETLEKHRLREEIDELRDEHTDGTDLVEDKQNGVDLHSQAGRLLIAHLNRRQDMAKASVFRHWSCQTSATRAISQQSIAAAALAEQLDATREKLVVLKQHMKRKGRPMSPSLGSISESEGYDTS